MGAIGQGAMMMADGGKTDNEGKAPERIVARRTRQLPDGFRPGIDPEFMYFQTPLNPSAAEVMGTSSSRRPEIPPLIPTNTMSYGIPGVIDPYKAFNSQMFAPVQTMVSDTAWVNVSFTDWHNNYKDKTFGIILK